MNQNTNAAKAAGVSAPQKENAPTESSKGALMKHHYFIALVHCIDAVSYFALLVLSSIAYWLHKGGAV